MESYTTTAGGSESLQIRHRSCKCECSVSGGVICCEEGKGDMENVFHIVTTIAAMPVM